MIWHVNFQGLNKKCLTETDCNTTKDAASSVLLFKEEVCIYPYRQMISLFLTISLFFFLSSLSPSPSYLSLSLTLSPSLPSLLHLYPPSSFTLPFLLLSPSPPQDYPISPNPHTFSLFLPLHLPWPPSHSSFPSLYDLLKVPHSTFFDPSVILFRCSRKIKVVSYGAFVHRKIIAFGMKCEANYKIVSYFPPANKRGI